MSARVEFRGFVGSAFRTQSLKLDSQDLWNWYLERAESPTAKTRQALLPCPGFKTFVELPTSPVRGLFAMNNRLFAVAGAVLYEISRLGAVTARPATTLTRPSTPIITNSPLTPAILAPKTPVVTHGGTLGSTHYGYTITATNAYGETEGSAEGTSEYGNATLSGTNWNIVSWTYVEGATGYKVYRTSAPTVDKKLIAVVASTTLVVHDIGAQATTAVPPPANTTGGTVGTATYGYKITATIGTGETSPSGEGMTFTGPAVLTSIDYNLIVWSRVPNARGYKVYRTTGTLQDGTILPPRLIGTVSDEDPTNVEAMQFKDTGIEGEEVAPPTTNTTGLATLFDDGAPVSFSSSGDAGNQMLIVSGGFAYCYDLLSDVLAQVVEGATYGGFIDSYFVVLDAGSSTLRVSESFDGFRWDPTQVYQRARAGDKWLSMAVTSNEIWLIGSQTGEVWQGTGQFESRFAPYTPVFLETGTIASSSLVRIAGALMWLAQDKDGAGFVVRTTGYTPQPVSTIAVTFSIQSLSTIADAFAFTYQQEGHTFYVLTFPSDEMTWVYDITTNEWHKRGWWDSDAMRFRGYRPQCHAFAFGGVGFGKNLVGDRLSGIVAEMDPIFGLDIPGTVIRRVRQSPHVVLRDQEVTCDRMQMDMDVGHGLSAQGPVALPPYPAAVLNDGASHYWRLSELSGNVTADQVGGAYGSIGGGVTLGQAPAIKGGSAAMLFDGTTGKIVTQAVALRFPLPYTVEGWVKLTTLDWSPIIGRMIADGTHPYFAVVQGRPYFYAGYATAAWGLRAVNDNQWHHLVAVVTAATATLYVDGVLDLSAAHDPYPALVVPAQIGLGYDDPSKDAAPGVNPSVGHYSGWLDEIAIYEHALTQTQIANHFAQRNAPYYSTGSDPTMMLCSSKDGGRSFGNELWRSAGKQGQTSIQVAWNRLGTTKDRVFKLVVSDPVPWRLVGAWLELEGS